MLVWMYCTPHGGFAITGDTIRAVTIPPAPSCPEATSETDIAGSGSGGQLMTGVRFGAGGRSFGIFEAGVAPWLLRPRMVSFPIRWGFGFRF